MKLILIAFLFLPFGVFAGTTAVVPPAPLPTGVPATASYTIDCIGIADDTTAACNTVYSWKKYVNRFCCNYQRQVSAIYRNGTAISLKPLPGESHTRVGGITRSGKAWGQSSAALYTFSIVIWDAAGNPTSYGPGEASDVTDSGYIVSGARIYSPATAAWLDVPRALKLFGMAENGDFVGVFDVGNGHACLYRYSDFTAIIDIEDTCAYPALGTFINYPERMRINDADVVIWSYTYATAPALGLRAAADQVVPDIYNAYLYAINDSGAAVGGANIYALDGSVTAISPIGFTAINTKGINNTGVVTGSGMLGGAARAFIYQP